MEMGDYNKGFELLAEAEKRIAQLERTNAALLGALKGLRNEIHGLLHWREPQLRELGGNTNVEVLKHKIALADAAIAEAESQKENGNG